MSLSDEIGRLGELHQRGVLSDDEFARAKARVLNGVGPAPQAETPVIAALNALRRSRGDAWLGGVCGGIAQTTGIATWVWRLAFTLLALCGGTGVVAYGLLWVLLPRDDRPVGALPRAF